MIQRVISLLVPYTSSDNNSPDNKLHSSQTLNKHNALCVFNYLGSNEEDDVHDWFDQCQRKS